jgi:hypothetical protein
LASKIPGSLPHALVKEQASPPEQYAITEEQIPHLERDGVVLIKEFLDEEAEFRTATASTKQPYLGNR